jgi:hypothetical protein
VEDEKVEWLLKCVGLELKDIFLIEDFVPKKKEKKEAFFFWSMLYIVIGVD